MGSTWAAVRALTPRSMPVLVWADHRVKYGWFRLPFAINGRGGRTRGGRFERDQHCSGMGQLADFLRGQRHARTGGHLRDQSAQAFHPVSKTRSKTSLLAGTANQIVAAGKPVFVESDKIGAFKLNQSDPFAQSQQMIVRQQRLQRDALQNDDLEFDGEFRAWISQQGEIDAGLAQSLDLLPSRPLPQDHLEAGIVMVEDPQCRSQTGQHWRQVTD